MTLEMQATALGGAKIPARRGDLRGWRTVAFSAPAFALSAMLLPVLTYLPDYYARELGIDLAVLALVLSVVRMADIAFDPVLGLMIDRSKPRLGRYRTWFVLGGPLAIVAIFMLYNAPVGVTGGYLFLWLAAANVGQSSSYIAHVSWAASAAKTYDQRSNVFGWMMVFSVLGMFIIMALPPLLSLTLGWSRTHGVEAMGWLMIGALPVTMLLALAATGEPEEKPAAARATLRELLSLARRGSVLRLLGADTVWAIGPAVAATLLFAYFDSLKGIDRDITGIALLAYFVGGMIGAPLWIRIARLKGKHRALMWSGFTYAVVQSAILIVPAGEVTMALIVMAIAGLPSNAGPILIRSMMGDVADEVRLDTGVDRMSLLMSLLSSIGKIGSAIMVGVALYILSLLHFDMKAGSGNSTEGLTTLALLYAVLPASTGLLTAWIIRGYRLDAAAHAEIRRQLDARDARLRESAAGIA